MGKSSINGPFSMAMLNNQRVHNHNLRPKQDMLAMFFQNPSGLPTKKRREMARIPLRNLPTILVILM